jgi:hypothetical protein
VKLTRLLLASALLTLVSLSASAQVTDTYVIPAAANARGAFGTHWMTRFSVMNPHLDRDLTISITWLPTGGGAGLEELVDLPPNSLAYSNNILEDLYGVMAGSGSLLVATFPEDNPGIPDTINDRAFLVNSETFNNRPDGSYGQTIEGEWVGLLDYESDGISSVSQGIRNSGLYRTNVGAVNLGRCAVTVYVNAYNADGETVLHQAPFIVPPLGHLQERLPVAVENGSVEFFVVDPCVADDDRYAVVFPYTSTVDQRTGDPSYQYPKLLANPGILYAKGQKIVDTLNLGKKIDSSYARNVRAEAQRRGTAKLTKTAAGWAIGQ